MVRFATPFGGAGFNPNSFQNLFANLNMNAGPASRPPTDPSVNPAIIYREQLARLNEMGFTDAEANIAALTATGGILDAALDRLISGRR